MAWIYLAVSEASPLLWNPGCAPSPIVKMNPMLRLFSYRECTKGTCPSLQSGKTCEHFEVRIFWDSLTSSTAAFHARTSVLQDLRRVWMASDPACFSKSSDWLANFDPNSCSWKTSQLSLGWGKTEWSMSSLRWGTTSGGRFYLPARLEPRTCAKDGGYLPTPTARDYKSPGVSRTRKANIEKRQGMPLSVVFRQIFGRRLHATFVEWMMGYAPKHTVLEDWAMRWIHERRGRRS